MITVTCNMLTVNRQPPNVMLPGLVDTYPSSMKASVFLKGWITEIERLCTRARSSQAVAVDRLAVLLFPVMVKCFQTQFKPNSVTFEDIFNIRTKSELVPVDIWYTITFSRCVSVF